MDLDLEYTKSQGTDSVGMKFVIAPDSFKESMDAFTAATSIRDGLSEVFKDASFCLYPMADGGEGTLKAINYYAKDAITIQELVRGPLESQVSAKMIFIPSKSEIYIEMAEAAGMMLVHSNERNPWKTSTYGVGELVIKALDYHPKRIVIALGGSITNDGGMGFLNALGVAFLNEKQQVIPNGGGYLAHIQFIEHIDSLKRLRDIEFLVLSDVNNPLLGESGATQTFSRQKGAHHEMLNQLEMGMSHYADRMENVFGVVKRHERGSGAAGGLGFALQFLPNSNMISGIEYLIQLSEIERDIENADIVFVGEGSLDEQSLHGKVPIGISKLAMKHHKRVIALVGTVKCNPESLKPYGIHEIYSINEEIGLLQTMLKAAPQNMKATAHKIAILLERTLK